MERDHCQPPARLEQLDCAIEALLQRTNFIVHRDPQRLKNFRRRMRFAAVPRRQSLDQFGQLPRRLKRLLLAILHDRSRESPRLALPAKFPENSRQFVRARFVHQPRRRQRLPRVHPHIQRPVRLKTEAALRPIQLGRTHAQVQQHSVATALRHPIRQLGKIPGPHPPPSPTAPPPHPPWAPNPPPPKNPPPRISTRPATPPSRSRAASTASP